MSSYESPYVLPSTQLEIFKDRGLINNKGNTEHFLKRMYLEVIFFRVGNNGTRTGSLKMSLFSCIIRLYEVGLFDKTALIFCNSSRKGHL